jgi:hypothetical protein
MPRWRLRASCFCEGDGGGPAYLIARDRERFLSADEGTRALVDLWLPCPDPESALIAELSATTYWTAPSDRWPTTRSTDYLGLPQFDDLNSEPSEVQTWF